MRCRYYGGVDRPYIRGIMRKVKALLDVPDNMTIYFLPNTTFCRRAIHHLPLASRKGLMSICRTSRMSFSFSWKEKDAIVILVKPFLRRDEFALTGLILHEIKHVVIQNSGLHKRIVSSFEDSFLHKAESRLKDVPENVLKAFIDLGFVSTLLLKDIYANTSLITGGMGEYILEYYYRRFSSRGEQKPMLYDQLKKVMKKDFPFVIDAFKFEFIIFAILIPFEKYDVEGKEILMDSIYRAYKIDIDGLADEYRRITHLYLRDFSRSRKFQMKFFDAVFDHCYRLWKETS